MNVKKIVYTAVGCLGLGLGAVGAVVPLLPAFPFLLLAAICFGKSSEKLNDWFLNTRLYKNNLESYIQGRGMTRAAKIRLIITVTVLMSIGFAVLRRYSGRKDNSGIHMDIPYLIFHAGSQDYKRRCYLGGGGGMTVISSADRIFPRNMAHTRIL